MNFGEPFEASNGAVIVTVSSGGRPIGIFTVTADQATWTPAIDSHRIALIGVCTGFVAAALGTAAILRRPPWPDLTERAMTALLEAKIARAKN
jgi:hypothetical protein